MNTKVRDNILEQAKARNKPVKVFITNSYQMTGLVTDFDDATVLLNVDGRNNLIFQNSISTIAL